MKNVLLLFFVFVYCTKDSCVCKIKNTTETPPFTDDRDNDAQLAFDSTKQITTSTTTISTPSNDLDDISIQDILSSDIDSSDKIEKKILNTISELSSKCNIYKQIELSLNSFVFPKNIINLDLGTASASFYNFIVQEESVVTDYEKKSYSTLIGCDSSKIAKVEVALPKHIKITANVKVNETVDSSDGIISQSVSEGVITVFFKNNSISKQFSFQSNDSNFEDETKKKLSYFRTEVFLDLDTKYQKVIHNNLEIFFNEAESSLEQFFDQKLNEELTKNNISVGQSCSKFIIMESNPKKINALFLKSDLNNLYVISNVSLETWKGVSISVGPVVIQGLYHFNSNELIVSGTEVFLSRDRDDLYRSTPRPDDAEKKQTAVRIKTNDLKGKLDWSYNLKRRSFSFSMDSIIFEVRKSQNYRYSSSDEYYYTNSYDTRHYYRRSEENNMDINVNLGNIRIKSSKSSACENEIEFVNFVLSEYLKTVLRDTLKNSLTKKLQDNFAINC